MLLLLVLSSAGSASAQCVDAGLVGFTFVEACTQPCTSMTLTTDAGVGDLVVLFVGIDGVSSAVDAGPGWSVQLRRAPNSLFSTWVLTRTLQLGEATAFPMALTSVGMNGAASLVTSYRGVRLASVSSFIAAADDAPESPAVDAGAGERVVDLFVTDTANGTVTWGAPPPGTCGRKTAGRIAYVDQVAGASGVVGARRFSATPEPGDETTGFALVLAPLDAGMSSDAGMSTDAGAPLKSYYAVGCASAPGPSLLLLLLVFLSRRSSARTS